MQQLDPRNYLDVFLKWVEYLLVCHSQLQQKWCSTRWAIAHANSENCITMWFSDFFHLECRYLLFYKGTNSKACGSSLVSWGKTIISCEISIQVGTPDPVTPHNGDIGDLGDFCSLLLSNQRLFSVWCRIMAHFFSKVWSTKKGRRSSCVRICLKKSIRQVLSHMLSQYMISNFEFSNRVVPLDQFCIVPVSHFSPSSPL